VADGLVTLGECLADLDRAVRAPVGDHEDLKGVPNPAHSRQVALDDPVDVLGLVVDRNHQ
jgi:hypothetical protein